MYVEIHSKDEYRDSSRGKSTWVNADIEKLRVETTAPKHLDSPPWHVVIEATMIHETSSGIRSVTGETLRAVARRVEVQLTPADVVTLVNLVLARGLLSVATK